MTTSYRCLPALELTSAQLSQWGEAIDASHGLDTPFLRPEFVLAVAKARDDVEVGLIEREGRGVGFFPFQRFGARAQSVSGRLAESNGIAVHPSAEWRAEDLFQACGLRLWHFDHLYPFQTGLQRFAWGHRESAFLDLGEGFEAYRTHKRAQGETIKDLERRARKLEREVGPLRFEWDSPDPRPFPALIEWKSAQHRRTGVLEIFTKPWAVRMLENLRAARSDNFEAPLSALWAGDRLIAVHFGMATRTNYHMWFPTFDPEFYRYSPGLILVLKLAEQAAARGALRLELGPGEESYKTQMRSGTDLVGEGMVCANRAYLAARKSWFLAKQRVRASKHRDLLENSMRKTRKLRQYLNFR